MIFTGFKKINSSNLGRGVYLYTIHITFIKEFIQLVLPLDISKLRINYTQVAI